VWCLCAFVSVIMFFFLCLLSVCPSPLGFLYLCTPVNMFFCTSNSLQKTCWKFSLKSQNCYFAKEKVPPSSAIAIAECRHGKISMCPPLPFPLPYQKNIYRIFCPENFPKFTYRMYGTYSPRPLFLPAPKQLFFILFLSILFSFFVSLKFSILILIRGPDVVCQ
jgi:hypothetical protein